MRGRGNRRRLLRRRRRDGGRLARRPAAHVRRGVAGCQTYGAHHRRQREGHENGMDGRRVAAHGRRQEGVASVRSREGDMAPRRAGGTHPSAVRDIVQAPRHADGRDSGPFGGAKASRNALQVATGHAGASRGAERRAVREGRQGSGGLAARLLRSRDTIRRRHLRGDRGGAQAGAASAGTLA